MKEMNSDALKLDVLRTATVLQLMNASTGNVNTFAEVMFVERKQNVLACITELVSLLIYYFKFLF